MRAWKRIVGAAAIVASASTACQLDTEGEAAFQGTGAGRGGLGGSAAAGASGQGGSGGVNPDASASGSSGTGAAGGSAAGGALGASGSGGAGGALGGSAGALGDGGTLGTGGSDGSGGAAGSTGGVNGTDGGGGSAAMAGTGGSAAAAGTAGTAGSIGTGGSGGTAGSIGSGGTAGSGGSSGSGGTGGGGTGGVGGGGGGGNGGSGGGGGIVTCQTCDDDEYCCRRGSAYECTDEPSGCNTVLECDEAADCPGEVCCAHRGTNGYTSFTCDSPGTCLTSEDTDIGCSGPHHCPDDEVCCGDITNDMSPAAHYQRTRCASECQSEGPITRYVLCLTTEDCPGSTTCMPSSLLPTGFRFCR